MPAGGGGEIASEGVQTFLSLLSLYADVIQSKSGPLGRYQVTRKGGTAANSLSAICLEATRRIELFVEILAERFVGSRGTLKLLLTFELIKAICRIYLCFRGKDLDQRGTQTGLARAGGCRIERSLAASSENAAALQWWFAGTTVHALRPVFYLAAVMLTGSRQSGYTDSRWAPWIISLLLDWVAHHIASRAAHNRATKPAKPQPANEISHPSPLNDPRESSKVSTSLNDTQEGADEEIDLKSPPVPPVVSPFSPSNDSVSLALCKATTLGLERQNLFNERDQTDDDDKVKSETVGHTSLERMELSRRKGLLLFYLLRPPAMQMFLKPVIAFVRKLLGKIPILGSVVHLLLDILISLEHYYSYSSGS
jgi:hypothetical protein